VRISAKVDYAVRAVAELASSADVRPVTAETVAVAQGIPLKYLLNILSELKHARIIQSRRGAEGGFQLARPADKITLAEVIRAVEGPLANIHEAAPEELRYEGPAESLRDVWVAVRANLRAVLESVTLADVVAGKLPWRLDAMLTNPEVWIKR